MRRLAVAGFVLVSCSVNYRADEAAYQCKTYGRCGGSDASDSDVSSADGSADGAPQGACANVDGAFCPNPDPAHCQTRCEIGTAGPVCIVEGRDDDRDTHLSAACTSATVLGDDCDDGLTGVHPGATEVCNGIDDDCNGKMDVEDGLPIGGTATLFAANGSGTPAIKWAASAGIYAVAWTDNVGEPVSDGGTLNRHHLHFSALDESGNAINGADADLTRAGEDDAVTDMDTGPDDYRVLSVAEGSPRKLHARQIHYSRPDGGTPLITTNTRNYLADVQATTRPTIAAFGGFSVAAWFNFVSLSFDATAMILPMLADGTTGGSAQPQPFHAFAQPDIPMARAGDVLAYSFVTCSIPGVGDAGPDAGSSCWTMQFQTNFAFAPARVTGPLAVSAPGATPAVAGVGSNGSQFVTVWAENEPGVKWSLMYAVTAPDGSVVCGPREYLSRSPLTDASFGYREEPSVTALADGSFLAVVDYNLSSLILAKLDTKCSNVETTPLVASPANHGFMAAPRIATSGKSTVVLWRDTLATATLWIRKMSPLLCDPP